MRSVDIVFHAAAMKHVDICEDNPFDAVKTNVVGTSNVIEVAVKQIPSQQIEDPILQSLKSNLVLIKIVLELELKFSIIPSD